MSDSENFLSNSEDSIETDRLQESQASISNNSFEHFLNSSKDSNESKHIQELQTSITTNLTGGLPSVAFAATALSGSSSPFFKSAEEKKAEFVEQVNNYITSSEFISSFNSDLGEPKVTETEDDFVERASRLLKATLKEKFKI